MKRNSALLFLAFTVVSSLRATSNILTYNLVQGVYQRPLEERLPVENLTNQSTECRVPAIDEFPADFLTLEQKRKGGVIIHIIIVIYLFCAVAIVCDEYFVQSLHRICDDLKLNKDVAAATFMAAGSSAPELLTSLVGVIIAKSDVGTGTIVGSALFNVLFITAVCALAAQSVMKIDWYPLSRDSIFYLISVSALLAVISDGFVHWYESLALIILYAFYILVMYFNKNIQNFFKSKKIKNHPKVAPELPIGPPCHQLSTDVDSNINDMEDDDENQPFDPLKMPSTLISKIKHAILFPLFILFYFTIPDPRRPFFRPFPRYFLSFILSTVYLGGLTYLIVWMVVLISYTFNIPDTVAGLTVLAAGSSVPEIVTGIIVTRKGMGEMAISNSLGSNVFDILMCLALPWLISNITNQLPVEIYSRGIFYSTGILFITVILLIICFLVNRWRLNKFLGFILIFIWVVAIVFACLIEYDVFGSFSIPLC